MTRKDFFKYSAGSTFLMLAGCRQIELNPVPATPPPPDIQLIGNAKTLATTIKNQYDRLWRLAKNRGEKIRIGAGNGEVVEFSVVESNAAKYPHLKIKRESDGREVRLLWGHRWALPSIKMIDENAQPIQHASTGKLAEFGLSDLLKNIKQIDTKKMISLGIAIVAGALIVWLGATIAKMVIGAIAFLAFSVMLMAVLAVGITVLSPIAKKAFDATGWDLDQLKFYFDQGVEFIEEIIREIPAIIEQLL